MLKKTHIQFYFKQLWLNYINRKKSNLIRLNLSSIKRIAQYLNIKYWNSHIVTVSGTNGKGSFISYLYQISKYHKIKLALYISPHILSFNERIKYVNNYISDKSVNTFNIKISKHTKYFFKSYFDFITILSFLFFCKKHINVLVVETGLGGRLDSTNIINCHSKKLKIGVLTSISIDHGEYLGFSIKKIFYEKLGILNINMILISCICNIPKVFIKFLKKKCYFSVTYKKKVDYFLSNKKLYFIFNNKTFIFPNKININKNSIFCLINIILLFKYNLRLIKYKKYINNTARFECISQRPYLFLDTAHNIASFYHIHTKILYKKKEKLILFFILPNKYISPIGRFFFKKGYIWFVKQNHKNINFINKITQISNKEVCIKSIKTVNLLKVINKIKTHKTNMFSFGSFYIIEEVLLNFF